MLLTKLQEPDLFINFLIVSNPKVPILAVEIIFYFLFRIQLCAKLVIPGLPFCKSLFFPAVYMLSPTMLGCSWDDHLILQLNSLQ